MINAYFGMLLYDLYFSRFPCVILCIGHRFLIHNLGTFWFQNIKKIIFLHIKIVHNHIISIIPQSYSLNCIGKGFQTKNYFQKFQKGM